jgi:ribonuclease HII
LADAYEQGLMAGGYLRVAGVDEVGRGPLAGPVVAAAAVVGDAERAWLQAHVRDSKVMNAAQRQRALEVIVRSCRFAIGEASVEEIDAINIRNASLLAMERALSGLPGGYDAALVDGNVAIPKLNFPQKTVVKGDAIELAIACASVVAKEHRDALMARLALEFPAYGWAGNAGYGTASHLTALQQFGVTPHHRRSFAPVKALVEADYAAAA